MSIATQLDFDSVTARRDEILRETEKRGDETAKALIRQAVLAFLDMHGECSANDFRHLLPEIANRNLIGAVMKGMAQTKPPLIEAVGEVTSTDPGTHAKTIKRYRRPS